MKLLTDLFTFPIQLQSLRSEVQASIERLQEDFDNFRTLAQRQDREEPRELLVTLEQRLVILETGLNETKQGVKYLYSQHQQALASLQSTLDSLSERLSKAEEAASAALSASARDNLNDEGLLALDKRISALEGKICAPIIAEEQQLLIQEDEGTQITSTNISITDIVHQLASHYQAVGIEESISESLSREVPLTLALQRPIFFVGDKAFNFAMETARALVGNRIAIATQVEELAASGLNARWSPGVPSILVADLSNRRGDLLFRQLVEDTRYRFVSISQPDEEQLKLASAHGLVIVVSTLGDFSISGTTESSNAAGILTSLISEPSSDLNTIPIELEELLIVFQRHVDDNAIQNLRQALVSLLSLSSSSLATWNALESWAAGWLLPAARAWKISLEQYANQFITTFPNGLRTNPRLYRMMLSFVDQQPMGSSR